MMFLEIALCVLIGSVVAAPSTRGKESFKLQLDTPIHTQKPHRDVNLDTTSLTSAEDSDADDEEYDEFYDVTVGDVIRDVLLTLRDHPEIVKVLIEREKEHLTDFASLSSSEELAGYLDNETEFVSMKPYQALQTNMKLQQRVRAYPMKRADEIVAEPNTIPDNNDDVSDNVNDGAARWREYEFKDASKYNPEMDLPDDEKPRVAGQKQHTSGTQSRDQQDNQAQQIKLATSTEKDSEENPDYTVNKRFNKGQRRTNKQIADALAKRFRAREI